MTKKKVFKDEPKIEESINIDENTIKDEPLEEVEEIEEEKLIVELNEDELIELSVKKLIDKLNIVQYSNIFQDKYIMEFKTHEDMNRFLDLKNREELLSKIMDSVDTHIISINGDVSFYFLTYTKKQIDSW